MSVDRLRATGISGIITFVPPLLGYETISHVSKWREPFYKLRDHMDSVVSFISMYYIFLEAFLFGLLYLDLYFPLWYKHLLDLQA